VLSFQLSTFEIGNFSVLGYVAETIRNDETEFNFIVTCPLGVLKSKYPCNRCIVKLVVDCSAATIDSFTS